MRCGSCGFQRSRCSANWTTTSCDGNSAAWEAALQAGGHPDYTIRVLPRANHALLEARTGTNAEMASLQRFTPAYFTTVEDWLRARVRGFGAGRQAATSSSDH